MTQIGTEKREIHVEPLQLPKPLRIEQPDDAPAIALPIPAREPVGAPK